VADDQTGYREKVIIDTKDKTKNPAVMVNYEGDETKSYNIPVGAHLAVEQGERLKQVRYWLKSQDL
jgi:DNA-directed RNA polymerase subunit beta'